MARPKIYGPGKIRINLELSPQDEARLRSIMLAYSLTSRTQAIKYAINIAKPKGSK